MYKLSKIKIIPDTSKHKAFRFILLVLVIAGLCLAYSKHFEKRLLQIEAESSLLDEIELFNKADRSKLADMRTAFRENLGLRLLVHVKKDNVFIPKIKGQTIFVGLSPEKKQAMLILPDLARKALPKNTAREFEHKLEICNGVTDCILTIFDKLYLSLTME